MEVVSRLQGLEQRVEPQGRVPVVRVWSQVNWLDYWDEATRYARESGHPVYLMEYRRSSCVFYSRTLAKALGVKTGLDESKHWTARTMHPAFMAPPMPKHDPERDQ